MAVFAAMRSGTPIPDPVESGAGVEPLAVAIDLLGRGSLQEAVMTHWHDTMVDHPEPDGAIYATGWTISGLAVLGTIVAVWVLGI